LMRADEGSECCRNRKGEEEVRPGEWVVEVVLEPLLGLLLLTLGAVPVAAGVVAAGVVAAALALRETVAIVSTVAVLDGA
jgi:hypothetical protein